MGTLNPATESTGPLISENTAHETAESTAQNARHFIGRVHRAKKGRRKPRANGIISYFIRWWIMFCSFLLLSWIEVRTNEDKTIIYCMDEVLALAMDLNVSNASTDQWINSSITTQMDNCATHMKKHMIANCDPLYWTYFTRSMLALRAIEHAMMNVPQGDLVQQWPFMDNCRKLLDVTQLTALEQCKETTIYTHCLENYTDMENSSTIEYESLEQMDEGAAPQKGMLFLEHFVSRVKLNVSRVFQNVTCGCVVDGQQKKVKKIGYSKLRLADVGWSALMAFIFSCLYVLIQRCLDGSVKRGLLKIYDYLLGSIWHSDGGHAYIRRRNSFSDRREADENEPIPLQQMNLA